MKRSTILLISILSLISIALLSVLLLLFSYRFKYDNYEKEITINYLEDYQKYIPKVCFKTLNKCEYLTPHIEGSVDSNTLGEYNLLYKYEKDDKVLELNQKVIVKDIEAPTITIDEDTLEVCPNNIISNIDITIKDNYDDDIKDYETKVIDNTLIINAHDSSNNVATKEINITYKDSEKPKITLNGNKSKTIYINSKYKEEGATVSDNCDKDLEVSIDGSVDTKKVGTYKINYSAKDSSGNTSTQTRTIYVKEKTIANNNQSISKTIYLTFDDGPSSYTSKLLDILKKYNVKATFFVTKNGSDALIKRAYDEGHTIALHTYTHTYSKIYSSVDNYFDDLEKISNRVKNVTGHESKLIRFPGGSSNTVSRSHDKGIKIMSILTKEVEERGYRYFDWNVSSGDAGGATTSTQVYNNVISNLKSSYSIVLQHDIKGYSVNAVEDIIKYGLENNYTFLALDENSPTAHHRVNN